MRKKVEIRDDQGMTIIVKTVTRLTTGLIFIFGIYIISHGHVSSEGGFAGGVIIGLSLIHLMLAYGKDVALSKMNEKTSDILKNLGAIIFSVIAVLGLLSGRQFFLNLLGKGKPFDLFSAGIMPICNVAIGLIVGAGIYIVFLTLVLFRAPGKAEK